MDLTALRFQHFLLRYASWLLSVRLLYVLLVNDVLFHCLCFVAVTSAD
jgi:hypothetical protein